MEYRKPCNSAGSRTRFRALIRRPYFLWFNYTRGSATQARKFTARKDPRVDRVLGFLQQCNPQKESLSKVDKFTYLRGLVEEPAKSAIAGFSLTEANYSAAVELLQRRFGNKTVVQWAHINQLMNVKPVFNPNDTRRLRWFFDMIESNYRRLQALQVDEQTYAAIVVPWVFFEQTTQGSATNDNERPEISWVVDERVCWSTTGRSWIERESPAGQAAGRQASAASPIDGECLVCEERRKRWMRVLPWKPQPWRLQGSDEQERTIDIVTQV